MFLDALDDGIGASAVRTLVITVFDECDFGILRALSVIFRNDGDFERGHRSSWRDVFQQILFGQVFERLQDAVGTRIHGNRRAVTPSDDSVFVDDEESSLRDAIVCAVGAVFASDSTLGFEISEEWKMEVAVFSECRMTPWTIDGDAKHFGIELLKLWEDFVIKSHLISADGTPVGGIKGEDNGTSAQVAQAQGLIGSDVQGEVRSFGACGKNAAMNRSNFFVSVSRGCGIGFCHCFYVPFRQFS